MDTSTAGTTSSSSTIKVESRAPRLFPKRLARRACQGCTQMASTAAQPIWTRNGDTMR